MDNSVYGRSWGQKRSSNLGGCLIIIAVFVIAFIILVIRLCGGLFPNYSDGERTGVCTKLSHKGLMWKSNEGSMNVGGVAADANGTMVPVVWLFSVQSDEVAKAINAVAEKGSRVTLHYHQFGLKPIGLDTGYVVDGVKVGEQWVVKPPEVQ